MQGRHLWEALCKNHLLERSKCLPKVSNINILNTVRVSLSYEEKGNRRKGLMFVSNSVTGVVNTATGPCAFLQLW